MYKFLGLYLLIIIGLFIEFSFLGTFGNTVIKILILSSVSYFLYEIWRDQAPDDDLQDESEIVDNNDVVSENRPIETSTIRSSEQRSKVLEIDHSTLNGLYDSNEIYKNFILNQFMLIWDYIYPKNGYIIYKNAKDDSKVIHLNIQPQITTDVNHHPKALFTLIDNKNGILIENNIEHTLHLIPFYQKDDYQPKSLLGFASRFETGETLYWVFDSDLQDTFNIEDVKILERVNANSEVMTMEVRQSSGLNIAYLKLNRKLQVASKLNMASTYTDCVDYFCDFIVDDFEASKLTIALRSNFDPASNTAKIYKAVGGDDPYNSGFEFSLEQGLNGWVIMKNKPHLIDNIEKGEYFVPRFSEDERTNYGIKSYLSVPIAYNDNAIGMVTLEDKQINKYTTDDKRNLIEYAELLSSALQRFENKITIE